MISVIDYFGPRLNHPEATAEMKAAANTMLGCVNRLLAEAMLAHCGYTGAADADTGTCVSGSPPREHMSGDGGFRSSDSLTGAAHSKHRIARAVDVFDPGNHLDAWISDEILTTYGLWREHPDATPGWCHLQDLPPGSGKRTYLP